MRRYFQKRFTHVLVDEFQDTDPIQAEVLFYLTGENVEETNWRRLKPREGIAVHRRRSEAVDLSIPPRDITTYLTVKDRIAETGGKIVQLTANFRSVRPICEFVNATFPGLFTRRT